MDLLLFSTNQYVPEADSTMLKIFFSENWQHIIWRRLDCSKEPRERESKTLNYPINYFMKCNLMYTRSLYSLCDINHLISVCMCNMTLSGPVGGIFSQALCSMHYFYILPTFLFLLLQQQQHHHQNFGTLRGRL